MSVVKFYYNGNSIDIQCNKTTYIRDILFKLGNKVEKNIK